MPRIRLLSALLLPAALAAVLFAIVTHLDHEIHAGGPLGPPGNYDTNCLPGKPFQAVTEGNQGVTNGGPDAIILDRMLLISPRHLRLTGAYVVPYTKNLVGSWLQFPLRLTSSCPA